VALVFFFSLSHFGTLVAQDNTSKESTKTSATPSTTTTTTPQKQQIKYVAPVVYTVVEKQPSYPGGQDAMVKFIMENIKYPEAAKKKGTMGTVFVTFVVNTDGSVYDVKILRGIGSGCDEEAARVVKLMPKWIPGESKGKTVCVQYNLPIKFALDNHDKKKEEPKK
jgi:protein TonB